MESRPAPACNKTEKQKAVVSKADQNASRVLGFIRDERRERGRRDAAAAQIKRKNVEKRLSAAKEAVWAAAGPQVVQKADIRDTWGSQGADPGPNNRTSDSQDGGRMHHGTAGADGLRHVLHEDSSHIAPSHALQDANAVALETLHKHNLEHHHLDVLLEVSHRRVAEEEAEGWKSELENWNEIKSKGRVAPPPSFKWYVKEVKVSHKMLKNLTNADMELLASFERPPHIVESVMLAVYELLEIPNSTWAGMRKMLAVEFRENDAKASRPHQTFKRALDECSSKQRASGKSPGDKTAVYPKPCKVSHVSRIINLVIAYTGHERDPKAVLKMLSKYTSDPQFTPENAGQWSKAALALCVWVRAVWLHFQEIKRIPGRTQIERAIESGAQYLQFACNTRVEDWLPEIATKANKHIGSKSYHDLAKSKSNLVRKVFHRPPPKLSAVFREAPDACEKEGFVRDVDIRASYQSCKADVMERLQAQSGSKWRWVGDDRPEQGRELTNSRLASALERKFRFAQSATPPAIKIEFRQQEWEAFGIQDLYKDDFIRVGDSYFTPADSARRLAAKEKPALKALCKFDHPAFASEAAGHRSWERYKDLDHHEVRFEDCAPRPKSVERDAKKAEELNQIYRSDVLIRRMVRAIGKNDHESVRKLVFAGADLEWTDDHGRTVFEIAKELRMLPCLKILDTCQLRLQQSCRQNSVSPSSAYKKAKNVVLPRISLAVPPRTEHGKRRKPIQVLTYREHVAVIEDKYKLQDPNEYVTESESSSSEEEEVIDRNEKLRMNTLRFADEFYPPLCPPSSASVRRSAEEGNEELAEDEDAMPAAGVTQKVSDVQEDVDQLPAEDADDSSDGGGEDTSSTTFLTLGGQADAAVVAVDDVPPKTASTTRSTGIFRNEGRRQKTKQELFDILHAGVMKGGIDDLSISSKQHEYLRRCQDMGIRPRPLVFGQPDPEHINLKRFGLNEKQAEALAVALDGLDDCLSLNLAENRLGAGGTKAICEVLMRNTVLTTLDLSSIDLRNNVKVITDLIRSNQSITDISLAGNDISDKALSDILGMVNETNRLRRVNLSRNFCGAASTEQLISLVADSKVSDLNVSWMGLRLPVMQGLGDVLVMNKHLTVLNLSYNGLCDKSANVLSKVWLDAVFEPTSAMVLKDLDLGHNRIQKKGAICLALAVEKVAEILRQKPDKKPFSIERIVLNGNPIGEVGVRACLHALGCSEVKWALYDCLLDSACEEFFERGLLEKSYELDMYDLHDRLVADQLVLISNSRFKGKRIVQSAVFEGKELQVPDAGDKWSPWDWDPMYYDDGQLEITLNGPWKAFSCRFIGEVQGLGAYFSVISALVGAEETGDCHEKTMPVSDPPEDAFLVNKKIYIECADGAESEMILVKSYSRAQELEAVFEEMYDEMDCKNVEDEADEERVKEAKTVHVFRVQEEQRGEWLVEGLLVEIGDAWGRTRECANPVCTCHLGTETGIYLHVSQLRNISNEPLQFQGKHQKVMLKYSVLTVGNLQRSVVEALTESTELCTCWYVDAVPLTPIEDPTLKRILDVLEMVLKVCGEDRLFAFIRGLAKDTVLTDAQASTVAQLFFTQKYQKLAHTLLSGHEPREPPKRKKKSKAVRNPDGDPIRNTQDASSLLEGMSSSKDKHRQALLAAGPDGDFFDLFSGFIWLSRHEEHVAEQWLADVQTRLQQVEADLVLAEANLEQLAQEMENADGNSKMLARYKKELKQKYTAGKQRAHELRLQIDDCKQKASKKVVAFDLCETESPLPKYSLDTLQLVCPAENGVVTADFRVVAVESGGRLLLLQDPAIRSSDGSTGRFSLLQLTTLGQRCRFEFPSRAAAGDTGAHDEDDCEDWVEIVGESSGMGTAPGAEIVPDLGAGSGAWEVVLDKVEVSVGLVNAP